MFELKGVGSATLDKGISIVVGSVILGGIVIGVNWLYTSYKTEEFYKQVNSFVEGTRLYYKGMPYVSNTFSIVKMKKAGYLPDSFEEDNIAGVLFNRDPNGRDHTNEPDRNVKYFTEDVNAFNLYLKNVDYKMCLVLGTRRINKVLYVYGRKSGQMIGNRDLPINNPGNSSKLAAYEQFCEDNQNTSYMSISFQ